MQLKHRDPEAFLRLRRARPEVCLHYGDEHAQAHKEQYDVLLVGVDALQAAAALERLHKNLDEPAGSVDLVHLEARAQLPGQVGPEEHEFVLKA